MTAIVAVKHYGFEWLTQYGFDCRTEAAKLAEYSVDVAILQNRIDPTPTTAAAAEDIPSTYDDMVLRDALRDRGISYFENLPVFFNPALLESKSELRPVGSDGLPTQRIGWYVGLCPSDVDYVARLASTAEEVVDKLQPDGLFLSWIRFPGFWELWTPDVTRAEIVEYCFCPRCLARFQSEAGISLPAGDFLESVRMLQHELRDEWTSWKCQLIAGVVGTIKGAAQRRRPDIKILVNTVALGQSDLGNAAEEVLGQRPELLAEQADMFELMFYHQILRREPRQWIGGLAAEFKARTTTPLLATLQLKAAYLEPIYAAGRQEEITPDEQLKAIGGVAESAADGVLLYQWADCLDAEAMGRTDLKEALLAFKSGSLGRR